MRGLRNQPEDKLAAAMRLLTEAMELISAASPTSHDPADRGTWRARGVLLHLSVKNLENAVAPLIAAPANPSEVSYHG